MSEEIGTKKTSSREIPSRLTDLESNAKALEELVGRLPGALETVMSQEVSHVEEKESHLPPANVSCEVSERINTVTSSLFRSNKAIESVLDKLQI